MSSRALRVQYDLPSYRSKVEKFFEPSVNVIVEGVKNIARKEDREKTVIIWLSF